MPIPTVVFAQFKQYDSSPRNRKSCSLSCTVIRGDLGQKHKP